MVDTQVYVLDDCFILKLARGQSPPCTFCGYIESASKICHVYRGLKINISLPYL